LENGQKTGPPRGRPKGAKNKRTMEREAAMREEAAQIEKSVDSAFEWDSTSLGKKRAESAGIMS